MKALQELGHEPIFLQIPSGPHDAPESAARHEELLGQGNYYDLRHLSAFARGANWLKVLPVRAVSWLSKKLRIDTPWRYWRPLDSHLSPETVRAVHRIIATRSCDICLVEYVFHSGVLVGLPGHVRKLIDTHDLFTNRHVGYAANGLGDSYWVSLRPGAEARALMRADGVLAIQEDEAEAFTRMLEGHPHPPSVRVVSHFPPRVKPSPPRGVTHRAAFVASYNSANMQALSLFLERGLPEVVRRDPEFRLLLAGAICSEVPDHPGMDKFGRFACLGDVFAQAPISLNPVLSGSGISVKALESLAAGAPVIATETGARGLGSLAGDALRILPDGDWASYAAALCELTLDPERCARASEQARAAAKDWNQRQRAALEELLEQNERDFFDPKNLPG
ncbi:glycosyltransferase [Ancylobacter aquaticus]|uniref:glycosyltransferase n=1 Tax=Ancylobacter aquaticus TaxID=100 RepID=UPI001FE189D0|nr:glycosyltransferase [Ancylobacter aquaticus]